MSIQEIPLSHNQKKKLLKAINDDNVAFKDDNGDVVVNVDAYVNFKKNTDKAPIEVIVGDEILDFESQYFLFS
jgi:hypothetical protein